MLDRMEERLAIKARLAAAEQARRDYGRGILNTDAIAAAGAARDAARAAYDEAERAYHRSWNAGRPPDDEAVAAEIAREHPIWRESEYAEICALTGLPILVGDRVVALQDPHHSGYWALAAYVDWPEAEVRTAGVDTPDVTGEDDEDDEDDDESDAIADDLIEASPEAEVQIVRATASSPEVAR